MTHFLLFPLPGYRHAFRFVHDVLVTRRCTVLGEEVGKEWGPQALEVHNEYVRQSVPADRLVWLDVREGWGPLCKALGKEVPMVEGEGGKWVEEPFPKANVGEAEQLRAARKRGAVAWMGICGFLAGAVYVGRWAWKDFL